jgi:hypothetical protein
VPQLFFALGQDGDGAFLLSGLLAGELLYPSANQPPPFNWKELIEMIFFNVPSQDGQESTGASERLCQISITSVHD